MNQTTIKKLFTAVESGDLSIARALIEASPMLLSAKNEFGLHVLGYAAHYGKNDIVEFLLRSGADVNAMSQSNVPFIPSNTALHAGIAGRCNTKLVLLLLDHGADVGAIDSLHHTPLQAAAFNGDIDIAEILVSRGCNLNAKESGSKPALTLARENGHHAFADYLIRHGAVS